MEEYQMANVIVLFEVIPTKEGMKKYLDLAAMLKTMLSGFDGFMRAERFESQKEGREKLFESYRITVCSAVREYSDTDRSQAPEDSIEYFRERV